MAKAQRKIELAGQHQIPILTITEADLPMPTHHLREVVTNRRRSLPKSRFPPRPPVTARETKSPLVNARGHNPMNEKVRPRSAGTLLAAPLTFAGGATRKQIAALRRSPDVVARPCSGERKFFATPISDPERLALAQKAASARINGVTRAEFRDQERLSRSGVDECWRDAGRLVRRSRTA